MRLTLPSGIKRNISVFKPCSDMTKASATKGFRNTAISQDIRAS